MRRFITSSFFASLFTMVACGPSGGGGATPAPDAGMVDGGPAVDGGDAATQPTLPFKPSNFSLDGIDLSNVGDFVVNSATCTFHSETKEVGCGDSDALAFGVITQSDASKVGVYVARNFRVEPNAVLRFKGTYGVAIVALDTMEILGAIDAGADESGVSPGGFRGPIIEESKGGGPGGGGGGSPTRGASGGAFCGIGGHGAATEAGTVAELGVAYGTPELIPLTGGSTGGTAVLGNAAGTGGGALHLVAGNQLRVIANGYVNAGGGGGGFWGAVGSQHGAGGGAGGAILLEATAVEIAGVVAANGGGGGAKDKGKNGLPSDLPAPGSPSPTAAKGGDGSAATELKGGDGLFVAAGNAPGGGGGAGRIRINTTTGAATITGKLSPAASTPCATQGTVTPR